jgi:hypothetical protein
MEVLEFEKNVEKAHDFQKIAYGNWGRCETSDRKNTNSRGRTPKRNSAGQKSYYRHNTYFRFGCSDSNAEDTGKKKKRGKAYEERPIAILGI